MFGAFGEVAFKRQKKEKINKQIKPKQNKTKIKKDVFWSYVRET